MAAQFPAYQNMIARDTPERSQENLEYNLRVFNCDPSECVIKNMEVIPEYSLEYKQGYRSRYQLHWTTYRGWKVYMLCTGCFASDPKYEC